MTGEPIDDVLDWSKKLSAWKQDALRRLGSDFFAAMRSGDI